MTYVRGEEDPGEEDDMFTPAGSGGFQIGADKQLRAWKFFNKKLCTQATHGAF